MSVIRRDDRRGLRETFSLDRRADAPTSHIELTGLVSSGSMLLGDESELFRNLED